MKCDLHIHSRYSYDSASQPKDIVDTAIKNGIQCVAIADHGNIKGSLEAREYARGKPILVIISEEVKSKQGDILALNIKEPIPNKLSAEETITRIHGQGGTAVIAHPFGSMCGFDGDMENIMQRAEAMEVLNASVFWGNKKALDFMKNHGCAFTVGSDAHFPNFIGKVWLELPVEYKNTLTPEFVMESVKSKIGMIGGKVGNFFEKAIDHPMRNLCKIGLLK
ncbi:MAG: PHP domain-containing protein [Candidatus Nealsonbacteria bacterium]|nr:PHP domain-containing protein [Candidatus Nealsonbacteria bacterium]